MVLDSSYAEKVILEALHSAKQWCMDCHRSRVSPSLLYLSMTPEQRREHALNVLQRVADFSGNGYGDTARTAIKRCVRCTDSEGMPRGNGRRILDYLTEQKL